MAEKYFLFQRDAVTEFSTVASNTGDGLSVLAIPASKLANVTAQPGEVIMRFDDAGIYDDIYLASSEGMPKTRIDVPCTVGTEAQLIEQILTFLTKDGAKSVMRFDSVSNTSTFSLTDFSSKAVSSKVPNQPFLYSGAIANDPLDSGRVGSDTTVFDGITFPNPALRPFLDYNMAGIAGVSELAEVSSWANSGTGGAAYNISANTGTPFKERKRAGDNSLSDNSVSLASGETLHLNTEFEHDGAYTVYMVYSINSVRPIHPIYGTSATAYSGGFGSGDTGDTMVFRHQDTDANNALAFANISGNEYDTKDGSIQDNRVDGPEKDRRSTGAQHCYVWVIRRDEDYNMYVHDYTGDVVGFIPRVIGNGKAVDYSTDGGLKINRIGGVGDNNEFVGSIARFGVVKDDIGTSDAARIARELFDKYTYYEVK